jgi:phage gp29-like protein
MPQLLDQYGNPIRREVLTQEIAGPTLAGVRSPIAGYPADGLTPVRLANILREADQGNPLRYFELAELVEERDLHYLGVLSTRKRSVAQIEITVEAASDSAQDVAIADMVRDGLKRDELQDEMFDMLDAVGKGVSFTEIIWDSSEGQFMPERLEWRDPRWFEFAQKDGRTPMLLGGEDGNSPSAPLAPFKFVYLNIKAKSGLPVRSGLARIAAWAWMFKAFTQRDWAIFSQTYGQPIRVGKYHSGASKEDRATLFRAVANIAGDCAAIIPEGMQIEFIESANVGAGSDLYERRADWLDRQMSKAVLGQTTTTDAISGGHAVSKEHREVQQDIERADARSLAAAINRELIRPWVDLNHGPQRRYPRVVIARPESEDLTAMAEQLAKLVPIGLRVQASEVRDKLGFSDPDPGAELLGAPSTSAQRAPAQPTPTITSALQQQQPAQAATVDPADAIGDQLARSAAPDMAALLGQIEAMMETATDLAELREMIRAAFPQLDRKALGETLALAFVAAHAAGRFDAEAESVSGG